MNRYALSPSKMQLQLRTAIQSSGNKAKKGKKGAAEGEKVRKKGEWCEGGGGEKESGDSWKAHY